jgi:predicted short-subunit dehydrogenase-like oxidoreductase (DUF2520 family)
LSIQNKYKSKRICLIGVGKVGSALYHSMHKKGYNFKFAVDTNYFRLKRIVAGNKKIKIGKEISVEILEDSDVIIYAVQEKYLVNTIKECVKFKLDLSKKILFHTSGIGTSDLFNILDINNKKIGSLHPLQTFNAISYNNNNILSKIYFGAEGGNDAVLYFKQICKSLNSEIVVIPKRKKILYHSVCVFASNFLVSHFNMLLNLSDELHLKKKDGIEIFRPIVINTINNIFKDGIDKSLTGPFERGDIDTIKLHLKYFKENLPSYLYYYILFGIETTKISFKKKSISNNEAIEINKLLLKYI